MVLIGMRKNGWFSINTQWNTKGVIILTQNDTYLANNANDNTVKSEASLIEITEGILFDTRTTLEKENVLSVPIAELATLGAGVSSLVPALRTITESTTINTRGLYRLVNANAGDTLKVAKDGNFWGAFNTAEGNSKFAKLQEAGALSVTKETVIPFQPATMLMAMTLFSIEQQLGDIAEMERRILSFLETEKEAEIEANVETLSNIISKYKFNWDNKRFLESNHKAVLDIQRQGRKNLNFYRKKIAESIDSKTFIVMQEKINSIMKNLQKTFKYYRLSLYTFSMASFIEVMLSGNFKEENIAIAKKEIESYAAEYRNIFARCSEYLEKMSGASVEKTVLKGLGTASEAVGKFVGRIPVVEKGPIDEELQHGGNHLKKNARNMERSAVGTFAEMGNPGIRIFVEKMNDMIRIYNHTSEICFDDKNIYFIEG